MRHPALSTVECLELLCRVRSHLMVRPWEVRNFPEEAAAGIADSLAAEVGRSLAVEDKDRRLEGLDRSLKKFRTNMLAIANLSDLAGINKAGAVFTMRTHSALRTFRGSMQLVPGT